MYTTLQIIPGTSLQFEHYVPTHRICPYPILFVHGMFGGSWIFRFSMEYALRHGFEVYALNLEGHAPGQHVGSSSVEDYAGNVYVMLHHINRPTILVGHSMGGLIAQVAIEQLNTLGTRALVQAAVFMASDVPGKTLFVKKMLHWSYLKAMVTQKPFWAESRHSISLFLNSTPDKDECLSRFTQESGLALRQVAFGQVSVDAGQVFCPTLVLSFEQDRVITPGVQFQLAKRYGSDYIRLGGDHMTFMWSVDPMDWILKWIHSEGFCHSGAKLEAGELCLKY